MKINIPKIISIITVAPMFAFLTITSVYLYDPSIFDNSIMWYTTALIFLMLFPVSAYALEHVLPKYKDKGRQGERKLAFIMAVIGYILGIIVAIVFNAPSGVMIIFLAYLVSGGILAFVNKILKVKASGHACGVTGPIVLVLYFIGLKAWYVVLFLPIIYWARLRQKRHTYSELVLGTLIGAISSVIVVIINR